jgi:hypothetical protein
MNVSGALIISVSDFICIFILTSNLLYYYIFMQLQDRSNLKHKLK